MKADVLGDDHESFPLENIKGIKPGIAYIHVRLPQITLSFYGIQSIYSSPSLDNQIIPMEDNTHCFL